MQKKFKKINAGALQYVLVISVIIVIILLAFVLLINLQSQLSNKTSFYKEAIYNTNYGFDFLAQKDLEYNKIHEYQFSENEKETTTIQRKRWGVFDLGILNSKVGNEFFQKVGLIGWKNESKPALYLKNKHTPLVLVGKSQIIGDAYLPSQGIKTGNIGGTSFLNNNLIIGNKYTSNEKLLTIDNIESVNLLFNKSFFEEDFESFTLDENLNLTQSFSQTTLIYSSDYDISLHNIQLKGNIIISSKRKIVVNQNAVLNDVILMAPEIEIKDNFKGNIQAFATKSIVVNKNCKLDYPSSLVLQNEKEKGKIEVNENVILKGVIIFKNNLKEGTINYIPQVLIKNNVIIKGEVYCEGNIELLGNIHGSVITNSFITHKFGSTYINHILNGVINLKHLPKEYTGLAINSKTKKVAKWLY